MVSSFGQSSPQSKHARRGLFPPWSQTFDQHQTRHGGVCISPTGSISMAATADYINKSRACIHKPFSVYPKAESHLTEQKWFTKALFFSCGGVAHIFRSRSASLPSKKLKHLYHFQDRTKRFILGQKNTIQNVLRNLIKNLILAWVSLYQCENNWKNRD